MKFLSELETRIGDYPFTVQVVSEFCNKTTRGEFDGKDLEILQEIQENGQGLLLNAVKCEKVGVVDFLIKCGVNVNPKGRDEKSAADHAWTIKNYKILSVLLEADSFFPDGFHLDKLNDDGEDLQKIKKLVENRMKLHEAIENGKLDDIINLKLSVSSKLNLNVKNDSAAYVAIQKRQFKIYAYLKSTGAEFAKNTEKLELENLNDTEKMHLQEDMVYYFPSVSNSHIFYLVSKSRSQKPIANLSDKLMYYFQKLDAVSEISLILKVIQYADYLDLIFDFEEEEVSKVNPTISPEDKRRGETLYKLGRIYMAVSSQRTEEEILGTIAHELTHMAMEILYENECNPYRKTDEKSIAFFKKFKSRIRKDFQKPWLGVSRILMEAMDYESSDHDSELIVRIPQILIQFKDREKWLKTYISEFYDFYQENIKIKCEEFINQTVILKPKNITKSINESIGEIVTLKNFNIFFENCQNLLDNKDKQVLLCRAKSTLLGILYILQGIYGKNYTHSYNNFLVVKFKNLISHDEEILKALVSEGTGFLIIEILEKPADNEFYNVCRSISFVLDFKPNKKILLVTNETAFEFLRKKLDDENNYLKGLSEQYFLSLSLDYLDEKSRIEILKKKVNFQGKPTMLKYLIQNQELYKFIGPETIELLLNGEKVSIGREIYGFSDLEGAYSDILQKINFDSLVRELKLNKNFFIISYKIEDELISCLTQHIEEKWINAEFLDIDDFKGKVINEKIILVNECFEIKNFKDFCRNNANKKCYFIKVEDLSWYSVVLLKIYNPNFYLKRKVKKSVVRREDIEKLICQNKLETFIISSTDDSMKYISRHDNVKWVCEKEAENTFKLQCKQKGTAHWFQQENDIFTWFNSLGCMKNLRKFWEDDQKFNKEKNSIHLIDEDDLVLKIISKKVVIIADDPGMGKSTTLTALYEAKTVADKHWIIRINLKDHLVAMRENFNAAVSIDQIIRFLQPDLKSDLEKNLFKLALNVENNFTKYVLFAFDGFDEILDPEDREKVVNLLKFLKDEMRCKIWITSRPQYKTQLEDSLETLAIEFDAFDDEMKKNFVEKYLKDRLDLIFSENSFADFFSSEKNSRIKIFKKGLLGKMKEIFRENSAKFIGTPLQLNLVMLGSVEYFMTWVKNENQQLDFNYLGNNVVEVYDNFIGKKYDVFFKKRKLIEKTEQRIKKKHSEKYHKELAESLVRNQKTLKPEDDDDEKIFLLIGLIQSKNGENFEFIHLTFREFYAAKVFFEYLNEINSSSYEKIHFVFQEIFDRPEFNMIRYFLNFLVPDKISDELEKIFFSNRDLLCIPSYTTQDCALIIAAKEGNHGLFKFLYSIYTTISYDCDATNILNETVIRHATHADNPSILSTLFEILDKAKLSDWLKFYYKCLIFKSIDMSIQYNSNASAEFLLKEVEKKFKKDEIGLFFSFNEKNFQIFRRIIERTDSPEVFKRVWKIIENTFSPEEQVQCLKVFSLRGPNALFCGVRLENSEIVRLLFRKMEKMDIENQRKLLLMNIYFFGTLLHAASSTNLELTELVLDKATEILDPEKLEEFLMADDGVTGSALSVAVKSNKIPIMKNLLKRAKKILSPEKLREFIGIGNNQSSILHVAVANLDLDGVKSVFDEILPEDIERLMMRGCFLESACFSGRVDILQFVLEKGKKILSLEKLKQFLMVTNNDNQTFLIKLVQNGRLDFINLIFENLDKYFTIKEEWDLITMKDKENISALMEAIFTTGAELQIFFLGRFGEILKSEINFLNLSSVMQNCTADFLREVVLNNGNCPWLSEGNISDFFLAAMKNLDSEIFKLVVDKLEKILKEDSLRILFMLKDEFDQTPLHLPDLPLQSFELFLCKIEKLLRPDELFELLVHNPNKRGTVLHLAAQNKEPDRLKLLFEKLEKVLRVEKRLQMFKITNNDNENILHAIKNLTSFENVKLIVEQAEKTLSAEEFSEFILPKSSPTTIFHAAVTRRKSQFLKFLLEKCKNTSDEDKIWLMTKTIPYSPQNLSRKRLHNSILHIAAYEGKSDVLKVLLEYLEQNFPVEKQREFFMGKNTLNQTSLHAILSNSFTDNLEATKYLWIKMEEILIEDWLNLLMVKDTVYGYILHNAVLNCSLDIVKLVLDKYENVLEDKLSGLILNYNKQDGNLLYLATFNRDNKVLKLIVEKLKKLLKPEEWRYILEMKAKSGSNFLHFAETIKGPRFYNQITDRSPITNLLLEEAEMSMTLDQRRQFLAMRDKDGQTALHIAAKGEGLNTAKLLLREAEKIFKGKDLEYFIMMKDNNGKTAFDVSSGRNIFLSNLLTVFLSELHVKNAIQYYLSGQQIIFK